MGAAITILLDIMASYWRWQAFEKYNQSCFPLNEKLGAQIV